MVSCVDDEEVQVDLTDQSKPFLISQELLSELTKQQANEVKSITIKIINDKWINFESVIIELCKGQSSSKAWFIARKFAFTSSTTFAIMRMTLTECLNSSDSDVRRWAATVAKFLSYEKKIASSTQLSSQTLSSSSPLNLSTSDEPILSCTPSALAGHGLATLNTSAHPPRYCCCLSKRYPSP